MLKKSNKIGGYRHNFAQPRSRAVVQSVYGLKLLCLRKILFSLTALVFTLLVGCAPYAERPQLNALQIEAMQTRTFDVSKRIAFNSVVTVFQNLGYIVSTADYETGFVTAKSPTKTDFFGTTTYTKTTAFVTERTSNSSKIRINFVNYNAFTTNKGQTVSEVPIENAQSYVNAFNKIRQQIFVSTGMDPIITEHKDSSEKGE